MRKIVAGLLMSLDGVVAAPVEWGRRYLDDEMNNGILTGVAQADAVLLGRRTYVEFAGLWPSQGSDVPMADFLNSAPKYVVSATLDTLGWSNSSLIIGDLAGELTKLKQQPGKNILIPGSPTLARSLLLDGLLDALSLNVCPVVVGSGMRLFDGIAGLVPLELVESTTLRSGVLTLSYQRAGSHAEMLR